jgi:hypothetical protein
VAAAEAASAAVPWLGLLVPAHNAARYLETCLRSLLDQAGGDPGIEVLVLDDASSDDTAAILERLAAAHPGQLRVLRASRNGGISAARNRLLAEATARHLWFVDADDVLLPGAIAGLRDVLGRHDPDLVLCDFQYLRERGPSRTRCTCHAPADTPSDSRARLVAATLSAGELHVWSKIARRELWQQVAFPVGRHFEDIAGTCQLLAQVRRWVHVHRPWLGYRQHPHSIMATLTHARLDEWMAALEGMQPLLADPEVAADPAAVQALADFRLRTLASALRRAARLPAAQRAAAHATLAEARARLFPHGTAPVLRAWLRRGWWLRALRTQRALRATCGR